MKILLLEDNERLNRSITARLKDKGYNIDSFTNGALAKDAVKSKKYDCYILDINVPALNGLEVLKQIRATNNIVPVIIISSSIELEIIRDSYQFGCDDYVKKPFFIDELEIKIEKLCEGSIKEVEFYDNSFYDTKTGVIIYPTYKEKFSKKEKLVFDLLLKERGKVVTYDSIMDFVWGGKDAGIDVVRSLVRRVRKKLPDDIVDTIVDVGYLLRKYDENGRF